MLWGGSVSYSMNWQVLNSGPFYHDQQTYLSPMFHIFSLKYFLIQGSAFSPMSSTNCPPIRRSQKWMILLQVINFVVWRCTLKILHCSEAQHQPRGLNYCGITFKGGSKSSRRALDRQCPEHGNGRISYRWCILVFTNENQLNYEGMNSFPLSRFPQTPK